jgi:repressor LexA
MVNYEDIGARIRARREHLGLTTNRAARKIGCTPTTLKRWEEGDIKSIKTSRMKQIADALATTPEALLGLDTKVVPADNIIPIPLMRTVPILGEIACGTPALAEENFDGMANIPASVKADFALRIKGDSMINARLFDGDLVFIEQTSDVENGSIAAVLIGNEATIKRVYKYEGRIELRPENPMYTPINIEGPDLLDVHIIGKPVAFVGMIR